MQTSGQLGLPADDLAITRMTAPNAGNVAQFSAMIDAIAASHRPSDRPFFQRLGSLPPSVARDPKLLGELYLVYQAAMHATRAAVYYMPHLDNPAMRKRKL